MTSIEERLQIKREPIDKWSIREQLCLAVARNSDQNLTSVSRALKPFGEPNRPPDWFHQKNCAAQYGALLANVETPKRKKRVSGGEVTIETPAEAILRKLLNERKAELKKLLAEEKAEYIKLQKDKVLLQSGHVTEEQLDIWCKEIDEEELKKQQETLAHEQWLRERELRKQEIERAWRPVKPILIPGQKRKSSETLDGIPENEVNDEQKQELSKPALSPLLTSLLKSPSQATNTSTSSILHSAITNQRPASTTTNTSPMIASLLNSSPGVTVSPGLQQLVSTAIGQQPSEDVDTTQSTENTNDILDDANLHIDELASSILIQNGPLPEMKNDVDVIISDLIENAHDIVADPEQHLQLDGNGDINLNLELEDFEVAENDIKEADIQQSSDKNTPIVDPFEFQEDPEIFEPTKMSIALKTSDSAKTNLSHTADETSIEDIVEKALDDRVESEQIELEMTENSKIDTDVPETIVTESEEKESEVVQSSELVESVKVEDNTEVTTVPDAPLEDKSTAKVTEATPLKEEVEVKTEVEEPATENIKEEISEQDDKNIESNVVLTSLPDADKKSPEFSEELYDDINMEVKVDKTGKAKRDYSRTKKKEDKDFDVLLAIEKVQRSDHELIDETLSDRDSCEVEKKDLKSRIKNETERSNSPWTEEEDISGMRTRRRLSTPATPNDSVPNSPVSSIYFYDDDREYRNWKKSVMLVYSRLAASKYASLFLKPITDDQAPGYHSIIYRPMDLQTIRKNIETGVIRTTMEFKRDVLLMIHNAIMYNKTNDTIFNMARQMQQESVQQIQILLQAQSQIDTPARRETRTSEPGLKRKRGPEENLRSKKRKED